MVSTNEAAVKLWQKFGFDIIGTTPKGFRHKDLGLVDTYIMFKYLPTNEKTGYNVVLAIGGLNGFVSMEVQSSTSIHRMTVSAKNPAHHHVSVPL